MYTLSVLSDISTVEHNVHVVCLWYGRRPSTVKRENYGKHEIILLDTCLLYPYLPHDWIGQYLGTYNNNVTHISSAVDHDYYKYRDTLLTWPCLKWYCKYDNNEVVLHYYNFRGIQ